MTSETRPVNLARAEKLIYGAAFFSLSSEVLMGLALPLLAVERGLAADQLGVLLAIATVGPILLALPAGALCDHFGDRRVLLTMTSGIAVTAVFYPFVEQLAWLFVLQILAGICRSNAWVAVQSYLVRMAPPEARQKMSGNFSVVVNTGLLIAPILGGALYTRYGATAAFLFMGFWGGCYALFTFLLPELNTRSNTTEPAWRICVQSYRAAMPIFLRPMLVLMLLITLARLMAGGIDTSFYPVYLEQIGMAAVTIGILMTLMNGGATVGSLIANRTANVVGLMSAMVGSIAVSVMAVAVLPMFTSFWSVLVLSVIHGLTLGISMPLLLTAISQHSEVHERGLILGLRSMFNRGGVMSAPLLMGFLVEGWGMLGGFLITGAVILVLLAVIAVCAYLIGKKPATAESP